MKLYEALARALSDNGVTTLFGLIGDANLFLVDAFVRQCGGTYVSAAHESGAALMGLGYASGTNGLGVSTVTHGPATVNTLTALVEGVKGRLPLLLLCGDTNIEDRENLQDAAQRDLIVATGAGFEQMRSPRTAIEDLATAMRRALTERRPIAFNMPVNFQWEEVEYTRRHLPAPISAGLIARGDDLDNAVGIIAASSRPVIVAGRGAAHARDALIRLGKRIGAPLATTLKGSGLFKGEPFDLGIFGTLSTAAAADEIIASDCVIAFGAGLNRFTTSQGAFLTGKRVIQVDSDAAAIGRTRAVDAGVIGDSATVADAICELLDMVEIATPGMRGPDLQDAIDAHRWTFDDTSTDQRIDPRKVMRRMETAVPGDRVFVTDAGRYLAESWRHFSAPDPLSFHLTVNFGSIGLGMAWAVGASYAAPDRPVLLVCGDGGFMHGGLNEFNTAVRHGRDIIVLVFNDGGYGAEEIQFRARGMSADLAFLPWPDLAPLAIALGGEGVTVRTGADLEAAVEAIARRRGPLLIDVKIPYQWLKGAGH